MQHRSTSDSDSDSDSGSSEYINELLQPKRDWITAIRAVALVAHVKANDAIIKAEAARDKAKAADDEANGANIKAEAARNKANDANIKAEAARNKAKVADDKADAAGDKADAAYDKADAADDKADAAYAKADAAYDKADAADDKADAAISMASVAYEKATEVRKLVLCFDGTGNQFSDKNSNVLHFFKCLRKDDETQIAYYQTGFGTETNPTFTTKPFIEMSKKIDEAIAWDIERHVQDAYRFLMRNYKPGDKISLFGFSRGAYTARVLCGFVQKVGLLPPDNDRQIPFAWKVFEHSDDDVDLEKCAEYKKVFSLNVKFDFIGLWDTVASLGIHGKELPFAVPLVRDIRVFRQALALDERRVMFTPNFKLTKHGPQLETETRVVLVIEDVGGTNGKAEPGEFRFLYRRVREVWFAGCHSDVGGGSVLDTVPNSLARIPLRWMILECFRTETGIVFDKQMLDNIGFGDDDWMANKRKKQLTACNSASNKNESTTPFAGIRSLLSNVFRRGKPGRVGKTEPEQVNEHSEEQTVGSRNQATTGNPDEQPGRTKDAIQLTVNELDELNDTLSPVCDQLSHNKLWWLLELFPKEYRIQDSTGGKRAHFKRRFNSGKGRKIYGDAWNTIKDNEEEEEKKWYIEVHESVRTRIENHEWHKSKHYRPLAWFSVHGSDRGNRAVSSDPESEHQNQLQELDSVNAVRTPGASVSEFRWEGELEDMYVSQGGQMIRWVK